MTKSKPVYQLNECVSVYQRNGTWAYPRRINTRIYHRGLVRTGSRVCEYYGWIYQDNTGGWYPESNVRKYYPPDPASNQTFEQLMTRLNSKETLLQKLRRKVITALIRKIE